MIIKIDTNKFETYEAYLKRTKISKQLLRHRINRGEVRSVYIKKLNLKLIVK